MTAALLAMALAWSLGPAAGAGAQAAGGPPLAEPEAPTVSSRVDRTRARVGDVLAVTITAVARKGIAVNLPAHLELGSLQLLDRSDAQPPRDLGDGHLMREFVLHVAAYETGALQIPPIEVTYLTTGGEVRTVQTAPIDLQVDSLLANVDRAELKAIAPPVAVFERRIWPLYLAGALLLAGLLVLSGIALARRWARRALAAAPPPPPRPAHEVALAKLDALRAQGLLERGDWKPFYLRLSEIVREYLGARFGFDGLEQTTTELLASLRGADVAAPEIERVASWSGGCDLVKFAKHLPTLTEAQSHLEAAYQIIDATRLREAAVHLSPASEANASAA